MNRKELHEAITLTLKQIEDINKEIAKTDTFGEATVKRRERELQYLQLWHIDHFENLKCNK